MKYRVFALMGMLALTAGSILQAQDYDDIYYDASKSESGTTKAKKSSKTVVVYGDVPDTYKVAAQSNYRVERDEDEYNRRGDYETNYEVDINGDTIYEEAFANTRRIERFYNPDIVILSDDDELVELYYDESPTVNLIVGSDVSYASYGWGVSSYYPWYTGWYEPWYVGYYSPWHYGWYDPWYPTWGSWRWRGPSLWGWNYWGYRPWHTGWGSHYYWDNWTGHYPPGTHTHWSSGRPHADNHFGSTGRRGGLAPNRNDRGHVGTPTGGRNGVSARGGDGKRPGGVSTSGNRNGGVTSSRGSGNMGSRNSGGVGSRNSGGVSRSSSSGSRSYGGSSSYGGSRSSSAGSRSSGSYSGGSRNSGSYGGGSRSSGGSYSGGGGSRGSSGGGSTGGSSGGGGRRR